ncbi:MAG: fibronectin type III domain-containing protein [Spirochaetes bacterium]|nr:fibronectin type III domain-containing protein [Spirochaetota bacterium]
MKNIILRAFEPLKGFCMHFMVLLIACFPVFSCYGPDMFDLANSDASKSSPEPPVEDVNNLNNLQVTLDSVTSGDGFVKIVWADPDTDNFTTINIYNESDDSLETSVAPGVQQVTIDGLTNGTTYAFLLRVQDDVGNLGPEVRVSAIPDSVEKDYILIHNAQELNAVRDNISADYLVVEDIDLAGAYTPWVPICDDLNPFTGTFNGNGHVIENMKITANYTEKGLFGYVGNGIAETRVTDVVLTGFQIAASNTLTMEYAGAIAGYCHKALIKNCDVSGEISVNGKASIGGITGYNSAGGIIENSESDVVIEGTYNNGYPIGGLVGQNNNNIMSSRSVVSINVVSDEGTGGLVGINLSSGAINDCSVTIKNGKQVKATGDYVGGFVGINEAFINGNCSVTGSNSSVIGTNYVGGFAGINKNIIASGGAFDVNLNTVTGVSNIGGFVGQNLGHIGSDANKTSVRAGTVKGAAFVGGFTGSIGDELSAVDASIKNATVRADVEYQMSVGAEIDNGIGGFAGHVTNTTSCNISGSSFTGAVTASDKNNVGGFIGNIKGATVTIENSRVIGDHIEGNNNVGGFLGFVTNGGANTHLTVANCYSNANISGEGNVGGFVGNIREGGSDPLKITFTDTATYGKLVGLNSSNGNAGGFAGIVEKCASDSTITRAYSRTEVQGMVSGGGFAGVINNNNLKISQAYVAGSVSSSNSTAFKGGFIGFHGSGVFESCYWDTDETGRNQAAGSGSPTGITGLTTENMHNSYFYDGWSFTPASADWMMNSAINDNYPYPVSFYNLWGSDFNQ